MSKCKCACKMIVCAELRGLFVDPEGICSGGSYVPIEVDVTRRCTPRYIRSLTDLGVEARVKPYHAPGEVSSRYIIANMDSIVCQVARERKFRGMW